MKETTLELLPSAMKQLVRDSQRERVLVTSDGSPVAIIIGIENKNDEDLLLETSSEFWRMIEERRRGPSYRLRDVEHELFRETENQTAPEVERPIPIQPRYSLLIQWSDEDESFIVTLPEFPQHY